MIIHIETIPHSQQKYETVGNYWIDESGVLQIRVSDMGNDDFNFLVGIHEMIEFYLTMKRGIPESTITAFDIEFEKERAIGMQDDYAEAGNDPFCPYKQEHFFATTIERLMAAELKIDWNEYDEALFNVT